MIVIPKVRGFLCTTAHPMGCAAHVDRWIQHVTHNQSVINQHHKPKKVLVIGASTGFGLASRVVSAFGYHAATVGVFLERPPALARTASPGWYNVRSFSQRAQQMGLYAQDINGDAFSDEVKKSTLDHIRRDLGTVDCVIYSLASPKRLHPKTNRLHTSVLKPIKKSFTSKTLDTTTRHIHRITIEPATDLEISDTISVMGGEDWSFWIHALLSENLLSQGAKTFAFSYIGPELTYPIYRHGTIGLAKSDLEQHAEQLNKILDQKLGGSAHISVNKALVTQASAAIPVVPLYISLLYRVMKTNQCHETCIEQMLRFFSDRIYTDQPIPTDSNRRIRMDDWEMNQKIQHSVSELWERIDSDNASELADTEGYLDDFYRLFGFGFPEIDYSHSVECE